jgi:LemA protein
MKKAIIVILAVIIVLALFTFSCAKNRYNTLVAKDEGVNAAWAQVENQYQRRYDLIPNLVETVKGVAEFEKETFTAVTEARAKVGGVINLPEGAAFDPAMIAQFQQAQSALTSALQRLMVVVEKYPDLKANQNFLDLQVQLEGTENRISTERRRFNETVRDYNTYVRQFPNNIFASIFNFDKAELFEMEDAAATAPKVEF